jgi:transcription termination factor Rho
MAIAQALGVKSVSRAKKAELIEKILEQTAAPEPAKKAPRAPRSEKTPRDGESAGNGESASNAPRAAKQDRVVLGPDGEPLAEWEIELAEHEGTLDAASTATGGQEGAGQQRGRQDRGDRGDRGERGERGDRGDRNGQQRRDFGQRDNRDNREGQQRFDADGSGRNRRRRRRKGGRRDEMGPQGDDRYEIESGETFEPVSTEPVAVSGYLDLRDEGYGFLRVNGYLPHRDDAYISVKQTRQHGLRKGDHVTGMARPAGRGEKNPALLEIHSVNGKPADSVKGRPRFEDLTPLFPDEKLRLEDPSDPSNMTARIIDLISPIGKGQRGLIVSPPKAGKTTVMKTIVTSIEKNNPEVDLISPIGKGQRGLIVSPPKAGKTTVMKTIVTSIEKNNPEVDLIVLLIDERPEEVTDMKRTVRGEVISSTFDRPSEEHTIVAEMAIEKAKRMVEAGRDVVVVLDGITRLSRAYNLAAPASGRIMSGGIDAGALYPPKKFFGAARNVEEGGSLTILATCLVETNSRMDEAIFEEFKGTGNMELRLDRKLAERRVYPAIDVDASSTRHEELLFDRKQLQLVWKLRRVLSGLAADGNAAPGLELLIDRLKSFRNNDEFLAEIAKQPSM